VIRKRWEDRKFVLTREQVGPSSPKLTIINQVMKKQIHRDLEYPAISSSHLNKNN